MEDIYIKSWSYAILNKGFFWTSMMLAMLVLVWPALGVVFKKEPAKDNGEEDENAKKVDPPSRIQKALSSASVQTSVTALAAFSFAFYAHYKEKQAVSETLMRKVLYAEAVDQDLIDQVLERMTSMDRGFGFSESVQDIPKKE